jgi:hypothetical protein
VKRGEIVRRPEGSFARIDGRELALGATAPAIGWLLTQRMFSVEDLSARYPFVVEAELRAVLQHLAALGVIVETEMR